MPRRFATRIGAIRANRFAEKKATFERFARIESNLRFAIFSAPAICKRGSVREPSGDSCESDTNYIIESSVHVRD